MKNLNSQFEKIVPLAIHARRALIAGSAKLISGYSELPRLAKTGIHIAACAGFVWIALGSGSNLSTRHATPLSSVVPESTGETGAENKRATTAREALSRQEAEMAEANRIHAEQQQRLVAEQIQARREQEAYLEQARYLQQLEMQQRQASQQLHYEAQQGASERANYEMQRYRSQMNGRPGF